MRAWGHSTMDFSFPEIIFLAPYFRFFAGEDLAWSCFIFVGRGVARQNPGAAARFYLLHPV